MTCESLEREEKITSGVVEDKNIETGCDLKKKKKYYNLVNKYVNDDITNDSGIIFFDIAT